MRVYIYLIIFFYPITLLGQSEELFPLDRVNLPEHAIKDLDTIFGHFENDTSSDYSEISINNRLYFALKGCSSEVLSGYLIKYPSFDMEEGIDSTKLVIDYINNHIYLLIEEESHRDLMLLQCFDFDFSPLYILSYNQGSYMYSSIIISDVEAARYLVTDIDLAFLFENKEVSIEALRYANKVRASYLSGERSLLHWERMFCYNFYIKYLSPLCCKK